MEYNTIIVRFGEMSTKGKNKRDFIASLARSIRHTLKEDENKYEMIIRHDHIYLNLKEHIEDLENKLKDISGMYSFSLALKIDQDLDNILKVGFDIVKNEEGNTFKIRTKRIDKSYPYISDEINRKLAGEILKKSNKKVDVHNPDITIHIEIREDTYIYTNEIKGSGGYPVGIQGKGILMLSGGIDSPVAGYLALKRGIDIDCLYFDSPPHTSIEAKNKVIELTNILNQYSGNIKLLVVPFTKLQEVGLFMSRSQGSDGPNTITLGYDFTYSLYISSSFFVSCFIFERGFIRHSWIFALVFLYFSKA